MEIAVPVSQNHIDSGVRCDSCRCALHLAVRDAILGLGFVDYGPFEVFAGTIRWYGGRFGRQPTGNSADVNRFVRDFDNRRAVFPQTLTIEVPKQFLDALPRRGCASSA